MEIIILIVFYISFVIKKETIKFSADNNEELH